MPVARRLLGLRNGPLGNLTLLAALLEPAEASARHKAIVSLSRSESDWTEIVRLAGHHLVMTSLWQELLARNLGDAPGRELGAYLAALHSLNLDRNRRIVDQAKEVATALAARALKPVFLKGAALILSGVHPDPGARFCGDIDLLVADGELQATAEALKELGYSRVGEAAHARAHDPVKVAKPGETALVELHVSPLAFDLAHILSAQDILERSVPLPRSSGAGLRLPCPTHLVVHSVAHAMLQHHGWRLAELPLRDALDLARLDFAHRTAIDWDEVADRLKTGPWGEGVAAFPAAIVGRLFPSIRLAAPVPGPRAQLAILRWRLRRGRPPGRLEHVRARLLEFADELAWRLANAPDERRRLVGLALDVWRFPAHLRFVRQIAQGRRIASFPGRRRGRGLA